MYRALLGDESIDLVADIDAIDDEVVHMRILIARESGQDLVCPMCGEPVNFRRSGDNRKAYFAHKADKGTGCPYRVFPAVFLRGAAKITQHLAEHAKKHFPDAKCRSDQYFKEYDAFIFLTVEIPNANTIVFRYKRKNPNEKEWHEPPTSQFLQDTRTMCIVVGGVKPDIFTRDLIREVTNPDDPQVQPIISYQNESVNIYKWDTRWPISVPLDSFGFDLDGRPLIYNLSTDQDYKKNKDKGTDIDSLTLQRSVGYQRTPFSSEGFTQVDTNEANSIHQEKSWSREAKGWVKTEWPYKNFYQCEVKIFSSECPEYSLQYLRNQIPLLIGMLREGLPKLSGEEFDIHCADKNRRRFLIKVPGYGPEVRFNGIYDNAIKLLENDDRISELCWYFGMLKALSRITDAKWWNSHWTDPVTEYFRREGSFQL